MTSFGDYDEDLNQNPFFQSFVCSYLELFSEAVLEKWVICVPKRESLRNSVAEFTIEDFAHHILKPLNHRQELLPVPSNEDNNSFSEFDRASSIVTKATTFSNSSSNSNQEKHQELQTTRKWNFETLNGQKIAYDYNTLFIDKSDLVDSHMKRHHPEVIKVLFEETFYTPQKQKYKVLCIAKQLNSNVNSDNQRIRDDDEEEMGHDQENGNDESSCCSSQLSLSSLRDCVDLIWVNGKCGALDKYDALIKLFLHNHKRSLNDLPLNAQRDLVTDLYEKCLAAGFKIPKKSKANNSVITSIEEEELQLQKTMEEDGESESRIGADAGEDEGTSQLHSSCEEAMTERQNSISTAAEEDNEKLMQNFSLATETFVLHSLYKYLMASLSAVLAVEDAQLNKILRNLSDVTPKDLSIPTATVEFGQLQRAKLELIKFGTLTTPLTKFDCLRRTMRQLQRNSWVDVDADNPSAHVESCLTTDELLPIFIWLIVKSSSMISNWNTQLEFMKEFRLSQVDLAGSENSFLLATFEAALTHLQTNIEFTTFGLMDEEQNEDHLVESRLVESGQLPYFTVEIDEDEEHPKLIEMIQLIRLGSLHRLEQIINEYEHKRHNRLRELERQSVDESLLCHPLCNCDKCKQLINPQIPAELSQSAFELSTANGLTLCHVAAICGRPKIVEFLLANGSNPNANDQQTMSPLHYAAARGHQNALLLLAHSGAKLEATDSTLNTPLHYAALNGHESCIKALIYYAEHSRQPLNLSCQNWLGDTPLHTACKLGYLAIVQLLVENGASITITNNKQSSPGDYALNIHITRTLAMAIEKRLICDQMTNHGEFVNIEMMKRELSNGVLVLIRDPEIHQPMSDEQDEDIRTRQMRKSSSLAFSVLKSSNIANRRRISSQQTPKLMKENSSDFIHTKCEISQDDDFNVQNPPLLSTFEPEHFKTIPVEDLSEPPKTQQVVVKEAQLKRKRREAGIRKLFMAIAVGDIPLALFYLGIPSDELENADSIEPSDRLDPTSHHPLCSCSQCTAKSIGFGLEVDVKNDEGLTPIHLAISYNETQLVKILLKYNANPLMKTTFEQKSPLDLAYENECAFEIQTTIEKWINLI